MIALTALSKGLKGVKYVVSNQNNGLQSAIEKRFQNVVWQRCQVHFMSNFLSKLSKQIRPETVKLLKQVFACEKEEQAKERARELSQYLREKKRDSIADWLEENLEETFCDKKDVLLEIDRTVPKGKNKEALAKIAFAGKFDDFDLRAAFGKLTYLAKDRQFTKSSSQGQKREFHVRSTCRFCLKTPNSKIDGTSAKHCVLTQQSLGDTFSFEKPTPALPRPAKARGIRALEAL
ncbi:MAG: transposase [Chlamydiota bacterium]